MTRKEQKSYSVGKSKKNRKVEEPVDEILEEEELEEEFEVVREDEPEDLTLPEDVAPWESVEEVPVEDPVEEPTEPEKNEVMEKRTMSSGKDEVDNMINNRAMARIRRM